jgi:hypothetical protein
VFLFGTLSLIDVALEIDRCQGERAGRAVARAEMGSSGVVRGAEIDLGYLGALQRRGEMGRGFRWVCEVVIQ